MSELKTMDTATLREFYRILKAKYMGMPKEEREAEFPGGMLLYSIQKAQEELKRRFNNGLTGM